MNYITIYDFGNTQFYFFYLIISIAIFFFGSIFYFADKKKPLFILLLTLFLGTAFFILNLASLRNYYLLNKIYKNKDYLIVEGVVKDFIPSTRSMSAEEAARKGITYSYKEKYTVNNIKFCFDLAFALAGDYGYHGQYLLDGKIKGGMKVRISFIPTSRISNPYADATCEQYVILKMEAVY